MAFKLTNKHEIEAAKTTAQDEKKTVKLKSDTIEQDYKQGNVNLRFLANKYNKTIQQINKIVTNN